MKRIEIFLHRLKPRIYICRDVVMIRWLDYEVILKRWFKE